MSQIVKSKDRSLWLRWTTLLHKRHPAFLAALLLGLAIAAVAGLAVRAHNHPATVHSGYATRPAEERVATLNDSDRVLASAPARRASTARSAAAQGGPNPKLTNVVHIAISPRGFDTKVASLPHAPFFLLVENRSGVGGVSFRLDRMDSGTPVNVRQKDVSREELDYSDFFDLPPGSYLLSEAGHPDWQCRITINP